MTPIEEWFDQLIVINLPSREDRWRHFLAEMKLIGVTKFTRFAAHNKPFDHDGRPNGNMGCTASHRGVLELICHHGWKRTLVMEDDCTIRRQFASEYIFQEHFKETAAELPADWDMFYLGAHYGDYNIKRISKRIMRGGLILTTSSYGITLEHARRVAPYISGIGPIDNLMSGTRNVGRHYIAVPRLMIQYDNYSDLQERVNNSGPCMEDPHHEASQPWPPKIQ